ncbi:hypothetical protein [Streptomyces sp. SID3343]|uniref:hypothetical protein n=1 Tax=Streptomyces sp. SID3343 TaxID=2690260 RepID=UPI00136E020F|nr:hypothetical protein [Streptomyces sp. SID3343]MYV97567.1 hypothetical protein [Streptomyces sp. SID3343]
MPLKQSAETACKASTSHPAALLFLVSTLLLSAYSWLHFSAVHDESTATALHIVGRIFFVIAVAVGFLGALLDQDFWWGGETWLSHSIWIAGNIVGAFLGAGIMAACARRMTLSRSPRRSVLLSFLLAVWLLAIAGSVVIEHV